MKNEHFIQKRLLEESKLLLKSGFYFPTFFLITQGIETLGTFLDKKPVSAKAQSKKRFNMAILKLFPENYQTINENDWLYKQLRCNISHLCSTGGFITLISNKESVIKHLDLIEGQRFFVIEEFLNDFHKACLKVINQLEKGELKQKAMALNEIGLLKS